MRRTPAWVAPVATVGGVALLVVLFLAVRYLTTPAPPPAPPTDTTAAVIATITSLPASEFDQVGLGTAMNAVQPASGPALTSAGGKAVVFYYGAEYCPYCAAERWALVIALSRFGTFTGLHTTTSSSTDVYANTPTFTFHGATYTSDFVDFQSVEASDREGHTLETLSSTQQQVVDHLDPAHGVPFIDVGNRYVLLTASYRPDVLSGMDWQQIAHAAANADTAQAQSIVGSANLLTAAICASTSNQPAAVCTPAIQAIEPKL